MSPAADFESDELEDVSDDLPELSDFFSPLVSLLLSLLFSLPLSLLFSLPLSLPSDFDEEDEEGSTLPLFFA